MASDVQTILSPVLPAVTPMPIIIDVCNPKGGVGKTTTCANLAAALAEAGLRVTLVDFDLLAMTVPAPPASDIGRPGRYP